MASVRCPGDSVLIDDGEQVADVVGVADADPGPLAVAEVIGVAGAEAAADDAGPDAGAGAEADAEAPVEVDVGEQAVASTPAVAAAIAARTSRAGAERVVIRSPGIGGSAV